MPSKALKTGCEGAGLAEFPKESRFCTAPPHPSEKNHWPLGSLEQGLWRWVTRPSCQRRSSSAGSAPAEVRYVFPAYPPLCSVISKTSAALKNTRSLWAHRSHLSHRRPVGCFSPLPHKLHCQSRPFSHRLRQSLSHSSARRCSCVAPPSPPGALHVCLRDQAHALPCSAIWAVLWKRSRWDRPDSTLGQNCSGDLRPLVTLTHPSGVVPTPCTCLLEFLPAEKGLAADWLSLAYKIKGGNVGGIFVDVGPLALPVSLRSPWAHTCAPSLGTSFPQRPLRTAHRVLCPVPPPKPQPAFAASFRPSVCLCWREPQGQSWTCRDWMDRKL